MSPDGREFRLPGAGVIAPALRCCPLRYVLSDDVAELAAEVALEPRSMLPRALDILRLPAMSVWIEFNHLARHAVLLDMGLAPKFAAAQKIGLLARASSDSLRRGEIRLVWEADGGGEAELCPIIAEFDFDTPCAGRDTPDALAWRPDVPQLAPVLEHFRLRVDPAWETYYRSLRTGAELEAALRECALPLFVDAPLFLSVILLTLAQGALRRRDSDLSKLNRARLRSGKAPLLDHVELHMNLLGDASHRDGDGDFRRQGPRRHMVRGHFVRRHDAIHWRSPHLRGRIDRGEVLTRNVTLRVG